MPIKINDMIEGRINSCSTKEVSCIVDATVTETNPHMVADPDDADVSHVNHVARNGSYPAYFLPVGQYSHGFARSNNQ